MSRICEEFGCLPSEALRELQEGGMLALDVMELRAYARAKEALEQAKSEADVPRTAMVEMVWEIQHLLMQERRDGGSR